MSPFLCTKNTPITVCVHVCSAHSVLHVHMYDTETGCVCESYKPSNASNNQLMILCAFSYTETCSFRGSQTSTYERFRRSKWHIRYHTLSLLPRLFPYCKSRRNISSRSCHGHRGRCYDRNRYAHIPIPTHMRILNDDEIRLLRRTSSLNDRSKLKGQYKDVKSWYRKSVGPII